VLLLAKKEVVMKYIEARISVKLKNKLHFQYAPERIFKFINESVPEIDEDYVFSNLGKANYDGYFEEKGMFFLRTFSKKFIDEVLNKLKENEDFITQKIYIFTHSYQPSKLVYTLNPVFVLMDEKTFWTFKSSGDFSVLEKLLIDDLIVKYKRNFEEEIGECESFIKVLNVKNEKPFSYFFDGKKFFGYKLLITPKEDEISQKLIFTALGCGLGHKNKEVGGGFLKILG
jgi:CRISPR-associated endoribonuclease Cas6